MKRFRRRHVRVVSLFLVIIVLAVFFIVVDGPRLAVFERKRLTYTLALDCPGVTVLPLGWDLLITPGTTVSAGH